MMVSAVIILGKAPLGVDSPAEFASANDKCLIEQATPFKVFDETSGWLVNIFALELK